MLSSGGCCHGKGVLEGVESPILQELKGHRSVGKIRISKYNAVPIANVEKLAEYSKNLHSASDERGCQSKARIRLEADGFWLARFSVSSR